MATGKGTKTASQIQYVSWKILGDTGQAVFLSSSLIPTIQSSTPPPLSLSTIFSRSCGLIVTCAIWLILWIWLVLKTQWCLLLFPGSAWESDLPFQSDSRVLHSFLPSLILRTQLVLQNCHPKVLLHLPKGNALSAPISFPSLHCSVSGNIRAQQAPRMILKSGSNFRFRLWQFLSTWTQIYDEKKRLRFLNAFSVMPRQHCLSSTQGCCFQSANCTELHPAVQLAMLWCVLLALRRL